MNSHGEGIGAICVSNSGNIYSGGIDGIIRITQQDGKEVGNHEADGSITALCVLEVWAYHVICKFWT